MYKRQRLRPLLLPSVPCSDLLYTKWARRYHERVAPTFWADEASREGVCTLEAQYTCHLHHNRFSEAEGAAILEAISSLRDGVIQTAARAHGAPDARTRPRRGGNGDAKAARRRARAV